MKALISVISEKSTVSSSLTLRGKEEKINQDIADYIEKEIKKELSIGKKPNKVDVVIIDKNRIVNKWVYRPTIR